MLRVLPALLVFVPLAFLGGPSGATPVDETVQVSEYLFNPPVLAVAPGTTVVFENVGALAHQIQSKVNAVVAEVPTSTAGEVDGFAAPGGSWGHTFDTAGVYVLNCNLGDAHGAMKMVIVVQ